MRHKNPFTKKTVFTILMIVMAVVVLLGGSYAIYTSQVFQRAVVRNRNADVIRFSSDKLYRVATSTPLQTYYYPMSKGQTTMSFTICNFDQNKNTLICEKDINYIIEFSIPDSNQFSYSVTDGSGKTYNSYGETCSNMFLYPFSVTWKIVYFRSKQMGCSQFLLRWRKTHSWTCLCQ